jgi:hypothetical protein
MSNVTPLFPSFPTASSPSKSRSDTESRPSALSEVMRAGLEELKQELQAFLEAEDHQ